MSTLNIKSSFSIEVNGLSITGQHGTAGESVDDPFAIVVDGKYEHKASELADDAVRTIWDDDSASPSEFDYMFLWSDQDLQLQIIGATLNVQLLVKAKVPFVLGYDSVLAAINTTLLSAAAVVSFEDIDSILISNVSGSTAKYVFFVVD